VAGEISISKVVEKKSPLTAKPLRQAGQSLREEIQDKAYDGILVHYLLIVTFGVLVGLEWIFWYLELPRMPYVMTVIVMPVFLYSPYRMWRTSQDLKSLKLGRDGEMIVGEFLELLREDDSRVFHDLIGDGFNVDHVLITRNGVFTIETKTYSKPNDGRIIFDGKKILKDGYDMEGKLLTQARAEAKWVARIILESTGRTIPVTPVIVFPGWFVETTKEGKKSDVVLLNPRMLKSHIDYLGNQFNKEELMLISYHLSRHIRTS
jgi:hypothetical protein